MTTAAVIAAGSILVVSWGADRSAAATQQVTWQPALSASGIVDLAGPRSDGRLVAAVRQGLSLFGRNSLTPFAFATGPGSYVPAAGEPYIALTPKTRLRKAHCSFHRDEIFAIAHDPARVVRITRAGFASAFAAIPGTFLSGIGFDRVGTFGHRLLVTSTANGRTTLFGIDCRGRVSPIVVNGPLVEGGIQVAPRSFGRFGGQLIAADEFSGSVVAFKRDGRSSTIAVPALPAGPDIGVESVGFVPPGLEKHGAAYLADEGVPGNPHPGSDAILRLSASQLRAAGVRTGDLLVATEAGAETVAIRCRKRKRCGVRVVGTGPDIAHAEGHIVFRR